MSEVIRCRDCKYGELRKNARGEDIVICKNPDPPWLEEIAIMPDWYCADAELTEKDGATVNSPASVGIHPALSESSMICLCPLLA